MMCVRSIYVHITNLPKGLLEYPCLPPHSDLSISNFPRTTPGWKQFERKSKFKSANNASPHSAHPQKALHLSETSWGLSCNIVNESVDLTTLLQKLPLSTEYGSQYDKLWTKSRNLP